MRYNRLLVVFSILCVILGYISPAAAIEYIYVGPNNGTWSEKTNWSPQPLAYPYGDTTSARINASSTNVNVYLEPTGGLANLYINGITVDTGDTLTFKNCSTVLTGTNPFINNNGNIIFTHDYSAFMNQTESTTSTFSGTGTLTLGSSIGTGTFINESGHTIRGAGEITANIDNRGLIMADGGELFIGNPPHQLQQSDTGVLTTAGSGSTLSAYPYLN